MTDKIIPFPKHYELKKLMQEQNIDLSAFSQQKLNDIETAITFIRRSRGVFDSKFLKLVIDFLKNDWLPEEIPIHIPPSPR